MSTAVSLSRKKNKAQVASSRNHSTTAAKGRRQHPQAAEDDGIVCTGKSCQSCTAGMIADCIAVCCCPCAVVNILAFAFIKLPWMVGRKCLGKSRRRRLKCRRKCERSCGEGCCGVVDVDGICGKARPSEVMSDIVSPDEESPENFSAGLDHQAGESWLELCHLGFGRVSFTGIPSQTKPN